MRQLIQVATVFFLIVVFVALLSAAIGWKFEKILKTLGEVMKLEISSVPGRVSLVTNLLMLATFLIVFTSHEAMALVKALVNPELESSSFNANFGISVVALMFLGNLGVLAFLNSGKKRKSHNQESKEFREL